MTAPRWLCRVHRVAGIAADPPCCHDARAIGGGEVAAWYRLRLDAKPATVRAWIVGAAVDRAWSMAALGAHVHDRGRVWCLGRAAPADAGDEAERPTVDLRGVLAS